MNKVEKPENTNTRNTLPFGLHISVTATAASAWRK